MPRTSRAILEQRAFALMAVIEVEANPQTHTAFIAHRNFCNKLGTSTNCIRLTLDSLIDKGWVAKCERFLPNGGQLENAYILTPLGREELKAHLEKTKEGALQQA